jgi:hypothetical protein
MTYLKSIVSAMVLNLWLLWLALVLELGGIINTSLESEKLEIEFFTIKV